MNMRRNSLVLSIGMFIACSGAAAESTSIVDTSVAASSTLPPVASISIHVLPVFDNQDSHISRVSARIKAQTAEATLLREIPFDIGDTITPTTLKETTRHLISLAYIRNPTVSTRVDKKGTHITVTAHDTWTFIPIIGVTTGDGKNSRYFGASDSNLGGWGKAVDFIYTADDEKDSVGAGYADPRLLGSDVAFSTRYTGRTDGDLFGAQIGYPLRTRLDTSGWKLEASQADVVGRLYDAAEETFIYGGKRSVARAEYYKVVSATEKMQRRLAFGWAFDSSEFDEATQSDFEAIDVNPLSVSRDPALLAPDRLFSGPSIGWQSVHYDIKTYQYIDRFERPASYNQGLEWAVGMQLSPSWLGADHSSARPIARIQRGLYSSDSFLLRSSLQASSRIESGSLKQSIVSFATRGYLKGSEFDTDTFHRHTLAALLDIDWGDQFDNDQQFLLGADTGLRGYEARTFSGDTRGLLTLEDRIHIAENVLDVASISVVPFFDAGGATTNDVGSLLSDDLYSNVGAGIRIGIPRLTGGGIIRLDAAYPLRDGPDGSMRYELRFLIAGAQSFSSYHSGENESGFPVPLLP
jgi:hypothetical protein